MQVVRLFTVEIELELAIGMVPPAVNLALSPEMAVTVGSASTWATPLRSKAEMLALSVVPPVMKLRAAWLLALTSGLRLGLCSL